MHRHAANAQAEPEHPDMSPRHHAAGGFGDQRGIGTVAARQGGERAVAGAFLLGDRLHIDIGRGGQAGAAQRVHREHHRRDALFHVMRAAAVHPAVADHGVEGFVGPHLLRPGGHDVDMALQDQAAALLFRRAHGGDDLHRLGVVGIHHRGVAGQMVHRDFGQGVAIDAPATGGEFAGDPVLARPFLAAQRGEAHQVLQPGDLLVPVGIDGRAQAREQGGIGHGGSSGT